MVSRWVDHHSNMYVYAWVGCIGITRLYEFMAAQDTYYVHSKHRLGFKILGNASLPPSKPTFHPLALVQSTSPS